LLEGVPFILIYYLASGYDVSTQEVNLAVALCVFSISVVEYFTWRYVEISEYGKFCFSQLCDL